MVKKQKQVLLSEKAFFSEPRARETTPMQATDRRSVGRALGHGRPTVPDKWSVVSLMFQIVFIELAKFGKKLKKIDDILELWLYLIKNAQYLEAVAMKVLVGKNPAMKETLAELEKVSIDPELLSAEEARRKALSDYNSNIEAARAKGKAKGITEGEAKGRTAGKIEIAKKLLMEGYKVSEVSKLTGLSEEELRELV